MLSKSHNRHDLGDGDDPGLWRVCSITPSRAIQEQLAPALMRCFPGAPVHELRHYPAPEALAVELGPRLPDVCLLDVISAQDQALALIPEIARLDSRINIVVLLAANEADLILKCLRLGASEFLQQPFEAGPLLEAMPKLSRTSLHAPGQRKPGKIFCVMPAKGACGASTVACNLAFQWTRPEKKSILLADMDPLTGTLSFLLKLKSAYSFMDALNRADTLDADLWNAMVSPLHGVDVLLAPESPIQSIGEIQDASPIIDFARRTYDISILDAGSAYGEWSLSQARASDEILLVTTNELPALHGAQRSISYLEANRVPKSKLRVVINRFDRKIGLSREVVASALHLEVVQTIPSDYESVQKALINGKPIPRSSSLGRTMAELKDRISGSGKEAPARIAPFGGILSLFGRT